MVIHRSISYILLIMFAFILASCGRPELSRQDAAKLIENNNKFGQYKSNLLLQENAVPQGMAFGWWQMQGGSVINLSPTIQSEGSAIERAMFGFGNAYMVLNKPAQISVTVTGIEGDNKQTTRGVAFDWKYKDLPPLSRRIAVQGGQGEALFQLFDDGWRMVELQPITVSKSPYPLSQQDQQDMAKDVDSERNRRATAEQAAAEAKRALDERIRLARTTTRVLSRHTLDATHGTWGKMIVDFTVTDVSVQIHQQFKQGFRPAEERYEMLFSQFQRPYVPAGYDNNDYFWVGMTFLTDRGLKGSPQHTEIINAVNKSFSEWQTTHAQLISECPQSKTWGCMPHR